MNKNLDNSNQNGYVIIFAIVIMSVLITMSASIWGYTALQVKSSRQSAERAQAQSIAEAGIEKAIHELNISGSFLGESNINVGVGEYSSSVSIVNTNTKEIVSHGYVPSEADPREHVVVKTRVTIDADTVSFNFALQVGEGGLIMANGSQVIGNLYSNGDISGSGTITGDATVAGASASTTNQECTTYSGDFSMNNTNQRDVAQRFTPTVSGDISKVEVYIKKNGSPSNINVRILEDDGTGTKPIESPLGSTASISSSLVTGSYGWIEATFSTAPSVTSGTYYWLHLDTSSTSSNYYSWAVDSDDSCTNGTGKYTSNWTSGNNPNYTAINKDLNFKVYMGGVDTSLSGVTVNGTARAHSLIGCTIGVDAYYDTVNSCTTSGSSYSGQTDPSPQSMPISQAQIDEWKTIAQAAGTYSGNYTVSGTTTLGPYYIDGDLTVNGTLYLTGPIWVKGDIITGVNAEISIDPSVGNFGLALIADDPSDSYNSGAITLANNTTLEGSGLPDSFLLMIATKIGSSAVSFGNNSGGAIFYAPNGVVEVSNNAGAYQLTAWQINLSNNATVTYDTGLANATFSTGPGGSYQLQTGSYVVILK
ncbi:MAG: hypothetical protein R3B41_02775 [Candidatus Doudnabacteria bacterium]